MRRVFEERGIEKKIETRRFMFYEVHQILCADEVSTERKRKTVILTTYADQLKFSHFLIVMYFSLG